MDAGMISLLLIGVPERALTAATYYVRVAGDDRSDGLSAKGAFRTLLRAAQALNHGDSVVIGPGTYREGILFAERFSADGTPMRIVGDEAGKQTGDASGPVVIRPARLAVPAMRFHRFRNLTVSGLTFSGPGDGLVVEKCRSVTVERCTFTGLRRGLHTKTTRSLRIESSVFNQCTISISLNATTDTRLAHLTMVSTSCTGILALACANGTIRNSILAANNTNALIDPASAPSWSSDHNVIHGTTGPWGLVPMVYFAHEWFSASGQDRNSVYVVPEFADPEGGDFRAAPQSGWGGGLPGMHVGEKLSPEVRLDRDGKPFRARGGSLCVGAYDYPEPREGNGWQKLSARLAQGAPRQSAGIYRTDGTLVRMLVSDAAGVRGLWWDGLDDMGRPVTPGQFQVRSATHDVRVLDDGNFGDNGNPLGTYNCDNAERIAVLPDGRFVVATVYDEAGIPLRVYAPSGQSMSGVNLAQKEIWAIVTNGDGLVAGVGGALALIGANGDRKPMANGAESYPIFGKGEKLEKGKKPTGLAVLGTTAYVALPGLDLVRSFDLANGRRKADWKLGGVADLATDADGRLWAISGTEVVALSATGAVEKRHASGLETPRYLAAGGGKLAVVDRQAEKMAVLNAADGKVRRTLGKGRAPREWTPVSGEVLTDPRGAAFLPDGSLLVCESGCVRCLWPETGQASLTIESNFMDVAVPHPTKPEYVYCHGGMTFRVDTKTGAWTRLLEGPAEAGLGSMSTNVVLGGRPFIVAYRPGVRDERLVDGEKKVTSGSKLQFIDVREPLRPRLSSLFTRETAWAYATVGFTNEGHLIMRGPSRTGGYSLNFRVIPYVGLDENGNPEYDFDKSRIIGPEKDPAPRGLAHNCGITLDPETSDIYYMAVTAQHNKMVPAWGASGTGVGKSAADGSPLWFSLSSGGNYTSIDCVRDARNVWILAGKDFGGQLDVFDADGLHLTTGNWSWASNWQMGFVDLRFAVQAYLRADGKPGAYVEDDNIGRFTRVRLEGTDTIKKTLAELQWPGPAAPAGPPPVSDRVSGSQAIKASLVLPKVAELKVDGDWSAWEAAGVVPQVLSLPAVSWGRSWPSDLLQTFRAGTAIGAFAHDDKSLYAYFVVTDDTMHFDATNPGLMWMYDSIEIWLEQEQIGVGFLKNGRPALFKYRYHNREGKEWSANYALPDKNVWGRKYDSLSVHPLGRRLSEAVGVSFEATKGYALMARIPFEEIKLVGGIADRKGKDILPMTGAPGEIVRIGIAFDGISYWGREQDFKVYWPIGLMFSDPTRNVPFVLGE